MKLKSSRGIVMKLICCMALAVVVSVAALAQVGPGPRSGSFPPKSGAMLEIQGTVGSTPIDLKLYDSQIHSGSVMPVPLGNASTNTSNCNGNDQIPTDAYVLQGGAPTGCDPGDPYEVTENNAGTHQASGLKSETKFSGFHIDTHYLSEPIVSITAASQSDTTTTYTYSVTRGADLVSGETIVVSGYTGTDVGNNGTFPSISVGSGTFSVTNASGVNSGQSATGTVSNAVCNHDLSICASPDTGFLTVTNNTHSSFSGTISLKGTSPGCGSVSDSYSAGLDDGGSVRLALAGDSSNCGGFNQAQVLSLTANQTSTAFFGGGPPASGLCAPQTPSCKDDYQFTPLNSASGDTLSVLPVPVPAGPLGSGTFGPFPTGCTGSGCTFQSGEFGSESPIATSPLRFSATNFSSVTSITQASLSGSNTTYTYTLTSGAALQTGEAITITGMTDGGNNGTFTITGLGTGMFTVSNASGVTTTTAQSGTGTVNLACVPYADFSAPGNPVCVELKIDCINGVNACTDSSSILYTVQNDYSIDANSLPNGIGGPAFIGEHLVDCPDTTFNLNVFTSYTAPSVTLDPLKGGGSGTPSCWVVAFDPSASAVTTGNMVSTFTGFSGLFPPPTKNKVNPGASKPLNFTYKTSSGTPVTNLHWCTSIFNNTGGNCNGTNNNGAPKPWVAFGTLPIDCPTGVGQPTFTETAAAGNSNLQNLGAGSYRFNLQTSKTATLNTCFVVVAQFDTGIAVYPDQFKYAKQ